jgi:stage V sporulation protein S
MKIIKVSSKSNPNLVSGAIINILKEDGELEMHTIGAGALNQAVKALSIARGYLKISDLDLNCKPTFFELVLNEEEKTGIKLIVKLD